MPDLILTLKDSEAKNEGRAIRERGKTLLREMYYRNLFPWGNPSIFLIGEEFGGGEGGSGWPLSPRRGGGEEKE